MSTGTRFDETTSRRVEAIYQTPDIVGQRQQTLDPLALVVGERVLDVGAGPGFLAAEMAARVGPTGRVAALDESEAMLAIARTRCAGHPWVEFHPGDATRLPYPDGAFDAAVATQVYEYVGNISAALAELHRVLRPGGRALVLDTDWGSLVWHSTDRARMARVLAAWDEHLADPHLPRTLGPRLRHAGFEIRHRAVVPLFNPEYDPNSYSVGLVDSIAAFVPGRRDVTAEEVQLWASDLRALGQTGAYFFSLNRYLFLAARPHAAPGASEASA